MNLTKHITEKRLLYTLIGLLLLSTFLDIYTAFTSPMFEIAETNPIYVLTGSKLPLLIITFIITAWIIKNINSSLSLLKIFSFSLITIYLVLGHSVGVYSNTLATERYEATEYTETERQQIRLEIIEEYTTDFDQKEKLISYSIVVGLVIILPYFLSFTAFAITIFFYNKRKSKREKIMNNIYKLFNELK